MAAATADERTLQPDELVSRRLRAERLIGAPFDRPEAVVQALGAVQAQDFLGAKWAVGQRVRAGTDDAAVEQAFARGAILRTHVMRPTWHFVVPADLRWLLQLTAPRVHAASAAYYRQQGLDDATFGRSHHAMAKALQGGRHLTRVELAAALRAAGVDPSGMRLTFLTFRAELDAVICSGARRGKQPTYAAFDERVPAARPLARDEALAELTRRYFLSHGPARAQDFAWWSGLKVTDANAGLAMVGADLDHARFQDQIYWFAPTGSKPRLKAPVVHVHLLPNYDEYLVAFRDHTPIFDARLGRDLGAREGLLGNNLVIVNGRVAGGWRRTLGKDQVLIAAKLLVTLDDAERAALDRAAQRYGDFLGLAPRLTVTQPRRRSARR